MDERGVATLDCPECLSSGSVYRWRCDICDSEPPGRPVLHPSIPLRFTDVVRELQAIGAMAEGPDPIEGSAVAAACRRAESLLFVLRRQFMEDVIFPQVPASLHGPVETFTSRSPSGLERYTSPG